MAEWEREWERKSFAKRQWLYIIFRMSQQKISVCWRCHQRIPINFLLLFIIINALAQWLVPNYNCHAMAIKRCFCHTHSHAQCLLTREKQLKVRDEASKVLLDGTFICNDPHQLTHCLRSNIFIWNDPNCFPRGFFLFLCLLTRFAWA